jgi:hypothetical protein
VQRYGDLQSTAKLNSEIQDNCGAVGNAAVEAVTIGAAVTMDVLPQKKAAVSHFAGAILIAMLACTQKRVHSAAAPSPAVWRSRLRGACWIATPLHREAGLGVAAVYLGCCCW